jgi:3-hydroxybutyryl-CoA dehydratase
LLYLDDVSVGDTFTTVARTVTETDIVSFACLSGDFNPLHMDHEWARTGPFGRPIAHGLLSLAISSGLPSRIDELAVLAYLEETRQFKGPVFPGDTIRCVYTVSDVRPSSSKPDRGVVKLDVRLDNQNGEPVQMGEDVLLVERQSQDGS